MPKVLLIVNRFNLGGISINLAYLNKYLSPDFDTLLIGGKHTKDEESADFIFERLETDYHVIQEMSREISLVNDYKAYKKIKEIINDFKPDIVHTHASKAGLLGRIAAKQSKIKIIIHTFHGHVFHSYFGSFKTIIYKVLERYLAKKTNKIIAMSNIQKLELSEKYKIAKPNKFEVIPLGFDLNKYNEKIEEKRKIFRRKYNINNDEIVITTVGRLVPIKNHKLFIDTINKLQQKSKKTIKGFIVGGGELSEELKAYVTHLGLNNTIIFTSWLKNIDEVNAGSDIIALTSLNEGTPVSLIEAQASGLPIVSTNVGGVKDITYESSTIIAENNVYKFTDALLIIINNYNYYFEKAQSNKIKTIERFSYKKLIENHKNLYLKLLE